MGKLRRAWEWISHFDTIGSISMTMGLSLAGIHGFVVGAWAYLESLEPPVVYVLGMIAFGSVFWVFNQYNEWAKNARFSGEAVTKDLIPENNSENETGELIEVVRRTYRDGETVILDGHRFIQCEFRDCMLSYNGGLVDFREVKFIAVEGKTIGIASTDFKVTSTVKIMQLCGLFKPAFIASVPTKKGD